jgi:hypothetical protein
MSAKIERFLDGFTLVVCLLVVTVGVSLGKWHDIGGWVVATLGWIVVFIQTYRT